MIIVDGGRSTLRGASREYPLTRYPQLQETARVGEMVEFQGEVAPCVALLALVHGRTGAVGDLAYAFIESLAARGEGDLDHSALPKRLLDGGR